MTARTRGRINGIPPNPGAGLEMSAERTELLGLGVLITVMDRLTLAERRRALSYLTDRFGQVTVPANVHVVADLPALTALLSAQRRTLGVSQKALAGQLGTQQSAVSEWESSLVEPGGASLFALADALGCDLAVIPRGDVWERAGGDRRG